MAAQTTTRDRALALIVHMLEVQHGAIGRAQALAAGATPDMIKWLLASGRWVELYPRVYVLAGTPRTWRQRLMGLCLWAGDGSAVSGATAAALLRFPRFGEGELEISTVSRRRPTFAGATVRRVDEHLHQDVIRTDGIPVTSVPRVIADLAGRNDARLKSSVDYCLREGRATLGELCLYHEQPWRRGRRGRRILAACLAARLSNGAPTDSDLELMFEKIIEEYDLPQPERQYPIQLPDRLIHVDFAYPRARLAIECDGRKWHLNPESFEKDRDRDDDAQILGWDVLRPTYSRMRWEPEKVVGQVRFYVGDAASV